MPASASVSSGVVGGANGISDDWHDEGPLSQSSHANSGATYLWQWILYADGANESGDHGNFDLGDIDGDFGPNTYTTTRNWQDDHNIDIDGEVGPQTFSTANLNLSVLSSNGGDIHISYAGSVHHIDFWRINGVYWSHKPGSTTTLIKATYGSAVFGTPLPSCIINGTCV